MRYAKTLGWDSSVLETAPGLNVDAIGGALARGRFDVIVAAGGDGTVAEVMAAAHLRGMPIGIVPRGTGNIVARELKLPEGWRGATRRVLQHYPASRPVDLARVNDTYSALATGIGFDATVMRFTPTRLKHWLGRSAYLIAGAWWLPRTPLFSCTIIADGEESQVDAVAVLVVNAGMLGASLFRFGPDIALDDGWLDVCVYRPRNGRERMSVLWSVLRQRPNGVSMIQRKAKSVEVKAPDVQWHEVDGDVYRGNVLKVEIVPGAVNVVV